MTTNFYLADSRFMSSQEIELAESYNDSAFLCSRCFTSRDGSKPKLLYSLGIPTIMLYNLPHDTRIVNNNNVDIQSIEELLDSIGREGILEHMEERQRGYQESMRLWLLSRPDFGEWSKLRWAKKMVEKDSEVVPFPEAVGAMQYINRK